MSDRQLLERIDHRLTVLAESFARHLGEHEGVTRVEERRPQWFSTVAAWLALAVATGTAVLNLMR